MVVIDEVEEVDIDEGVFKYILVQIRNKFDDEKEKYIVRGYNRSEYHMNIFQEVKQKLKGLYVKECGGGRIDHDAAAKTINVYGFSYAFGKADHAKTCEILRRKYPDYSISYSYEGY